MSKIYKEEFESFINTKIGLLQDDIDLLRRDNKELKSLLKLIAITLKNIEKKNNNL